MRPANLPDVLHHPMPQGYPTVVADSSPSLATPDDVGICRRLISAFTKASDQDPEGNGEGLWAAVSARAHGSLRRALENGRPEPLADVLLNGLRQPFAFGLGAGPAWFRMLKDRKGSDAYGAIVLDRLVSLGEALGILPRENPETDLWGVHAYADMTELCSKIEGRLGFGLGMPRVLGTSGVVVGDRLLNIKTPDHAYAAWRLRTLAARPDAHILEIGGGFGSCAWYGANAGVARYSIVDLPVVNVLQGYCLIRALGAERVRLFGEPDVGQTVEVLPTGAVDTIPERSVDVVFSQDALAELPETIVRQYLRSAQRIGRNWLLLIHHDTVLHPDEYTETSGADGELKVHRLAGECDRLAPVLRAPYWIRRGYVEEWYRVG